MRATNSIALTLLVALLCLIAPVSAAAAPFEFTVTAKKAFDNMIATENRTTSAQLNKLYSDLKTAQQQELNWDQQIDKVKFRNQENDSTLRKQIREINADKIKLLEQKVQSSKVKYEPLFETYDLQRKQLSLAKAAKNKELTSFMNARVEITKAAVQIAKQDIRNKEADLKTAKSAASAKAKDIRGILAEGDTAKVKIREAKSSISTFKKQLTAETKVLNQVVRKSEAAATIASFNNMLRYQKQINEQKSKIHTYEGQISGIIAKAKKQMNK